MPAVIKSIAAKKIGILNYFNRLVFFSLWGRKHAGCGENTRYSMLSGKNDKNCQWDRKWGNFSGQRG